MKKFKKAVAATMMVAAIFITPACAAGGLEASSIAVGIKNLINDVASFLTVLCPTVGGLAAIVFVIFRSAADEQDGKLWNKRIKTAIVCGVAGMLVNAIIALLSSYFTV